MIKLDKLYFGIIEDVMDPLDFGRVRVRVFGVHTEDKTAIPTDQLPWADLFLPADEPFISGIGIAPTGTVNGQMVALIPKDHMLQEWFVLFSMGGMRQAYKNSSIGFNDPDGFYPKTNTNHDVNVVARGPGGATVDTVGPSDGGTGTIPQGWGAAGDKVANRSTSTVAVPIDTGEPKPPEPVPDTKDAPWMKYAVGELGKNEKDNPDRIKEYHAQGGGSSKWGGEMPWCASFVGWCLKQAGLKGTGAAMARGYLKWGKEIPLDDKIPYGSIIVVAGSRGPSSGHVCFATGVSNGRVQVIGGNQSSKSFDNGGEVTKSSFPMSKVLGARWPS